MSRNLLISYLLFFFSNVLAQNHAPQVTNVTFEQRTDGSHKVDIYYNLYDADEDAMTVTMQASNDAGTTWDVSCNQISGDVGEDIMSGNGKHIVWDFGTEHPDVYWDKVQIKIIADDNYSGYSTGTITDIDGNIYKTVKIGNQWWMAEDLKVKHFRNGDPIPNVTETTRWTNLTSEAYCIYDNDEKNKEIYGLLYNWYAVNDSRNIAPEGWHVATDADWTALANYVKNNSGKLKEAGTVHWKSPNTGATNETGFTALPGGLRYKDGVFSGLEYYGNFWTATQNGSNTAYYRGLGYNNTSIVRTTYDKHCGFLIRCVKDQ